MKFGTDSDPITLDECIAELQVIRDRVGGDCPCKVETGGEIEDADGTEVMRSFRAALRGIDKNCAGEIVFFGHE